LEPKSTENEQEETEGFVLNDRDIERAIKPRQDLSASGIDGISYEIIKSAAKEGLKFRELPVRTGIKNGKIIETWKESRTILIHKKDDRDAIQNWRSISITNCFYRIVTCLLERVIQATKSKVHIYLDNHKGFIKKTNGCSEHDIILNELLYDARRNNESLIVTAIDFANTFESVPHEVMRSVMYQGATSGIKPGGIRSEKIQWNRGVK
jgi:hypothetical protein